MDRSADLGNLPSQQWDRLQDLVDRFEQACHQGDVIDLQGFLPPPGDPLRKAALQELIKTDLEIRWRHGSGLDLEAYLKQFPELGSSRSLSPRFIFEEYRARQLYGDKPPLTGYRVRFPGQYAELERLARELMTHVPTQQLPPAQTPVTSPAAAPPTKSATGSKVLQVGGSTYKLLKRIGSGGFAEVFQAEAPGGFPVAVKRIIRPIDTDEARRELQSLEQIKTLRHPFLLQTHTYYMDEDQLHIVMELADGTLRDRLKECHKAGLAAVPVEELLVYFREAAEALDYMHGQQLLHRDIKPHNLLVLHGHVKVADFGLARVFESQRLMMSASGSGTPAYMAPEVWRNKVSARSDQYSLALTYTELRLGRWPFPGRAIQAIMLDHISGKPDLAGLPDAEQEVLLKALSKEPEQRYENCKAFVAALEKAVRPEVHKPEPEVQPAVIELEGLSATQMGTVGSQSPFGTVGSGGARRRTASPSTTEPVPPSWKALPSQRFHKAWLALPVLALVGGLAWFLMSAPFELIPPPVELRAGEFKTVLVPIKRHWWGKAAPIQLSFRQKPKNVEIADVTVRAEDSAAEVTVKAGPDADEGPSLVDVVGTAGAARRQAVLQLIVRGQAYRLRQDWGWQKAPEATLKEVKQEGKAYYNRIEVVREGLAVPFLFIPREQPTDPPTFYIMEDKVWVALYQKFVQSPMGSEPPLRIPGWKKLAETFPVNRDDEQPVMGVAGTDAERCAAWLGGHLPFATQWDKAAGAFRKDRGAGPFQGTEPGDIAVGRTKEGTKPRGGSNHGGSQDDRSLYDCRDMAGNGLEWTAKEGSAGQVKPLTDEFSIPLRSAGYDYPRPFHFEDVANNKTYTAWRPDESNPKPNLGFRVVLEPEQ
jgi:serine/threonine protein kinase